MKITTGTIPKKSTGKRTVTEISITQNQIFITQICFHFCDLQIIVCFNNSATPVLKLHSP